MTHGSGWISLRLLLLVAICAGCGDRGTAETVTGDDLCRIVEAGTPLPAAVRETSGLAVSALLPDVVWTHNDRGHAPELFAIDADGSLLATVRIENAVNTDWEDLERGACAAGSCLYIADIGDNNAVRDRITIYEVPEPSPGASAAHATRVLHARYPDAAQDAESLFILPGGDMYIISKGTHAAVSLYRVPAEGWNGGVVTLEHVRRLAPSATTRDARVTGATASPDGRWVAVRTYAALYFFAARDLVSGADVEPLTVDLRPLGEIQGEGVAMAADGTVWLSSEAEDPRALPRRSRLQCELPAAPPAVGMVK